MNRRSFLITASAVVSSLPINALDVSSTATPVEASQENQPAFDQYLRTKQSQLMVSGVAQPLLSLNGKWQITVSSIAQSGEPNNSAWATVDVPGELSMQGVPISLNNPFTYRNKIQIPADFQNMAIFLRFDGVYSYARLWVNGKYIREHHGGFTRWDADITRAVVPGETASITVEVTDEKDQISYASGYAKHPIGGILRDVWLLALPQDHIKHLFVETDFDSDYRDAIIKVDVSAVLGEEARLKFRMNDPVAATVALENAEILLLPNAPIATRSIHIPAPLKWDAERPNLYTLSAELFSGDRITYSQRQRIGFRKIIIDGNRLLVNGHPVKFRGACRHDMHPLLGRSASAQYDLLEVKLAKEANINFIRTSHYPPPERFLEYADQYGLYVESESAVCFVDTFRLKQFGKGATQDDPNFSGRYLSQFQEMVNTHRNHPSVVMWSLGNESTFGQNFKQCYDWVKASDRTRPAIFSFPGTVPDSIKCFDILSMHYPDWDGSLSQDGKTVKGFNDDAMPVIFDEWAHIPCYDTATLKIDPNMRDFWGQSLDRMWEGIFEAQGGLGGAIWGMIDETFELPASLPASSKGWPDDPTISPRPPGSPVVGYGEWGLIDTWRRKKPEFWSVKKSYSPVRLATRRLKEFHAGADLEIPVYNRFDHTDLREVQIEWTYDGKTGVAGTASIPPHSKGTIRIPAQRWNPEKKLRIRALDKGNLIDEFELPLGPQTAVPMPAIAPAIKASNLRMADTRTGFAVSGEGLAVHFNAATGSIESVVFRNQLAIRSGPYLNFRAQGRNKVSAARPIDDLAQNWNLDKLEKMLTAGRATIKLSGHYNSLRVDFTLDIDSSGQIVTGYKLYNPPPQPIQELGVKYELPDIYESVSWQRNAYWSVYPSPHLGMPAGRTPMYGRNSDSYRERPAHDWIFDTKDFYHWGVRGTPDQHSLTNLAKAMKENVTAYSLSARQNLLLTIEGDGESACRVNNDRNGGLYLYCNNLWDYVDIDWGNYSKHIVLKQGYSGQAILGLSAASLSYGTKS